MSSADYCYNRRCSTTKGTTKNPQVDLKKVEGHQTCAFCQQEVFLSTSVKVNSMVGFVCRDCYHPIHKEIRPSVRPWCVCVPGGPFNMFWKEVPRIETTHYHMCEYSKCRHLISKKQKCCSRECTETKEREDMIRAEQARIHSWNVACSPHTSYTIRRGIN